VQLLVRLATVGKLTYARIRYRVRRTGARYRRRRRWNVHRQLAQQFPQRVQRRLVVLIRYPRWPRSRLALGLLCGSCAACVRFTISHSSLRVARSSALRRSPIAATAAARAVGGVCGVCRMAQAEAFGSGGSSAILGKRTF
jgi:hypothetical protein